MPASFGKVFGGLAGKYGATEILFVRTTLEVLRERVAPKLPGTVPQALLKSVTSKWPLADLIILRSVASLFSGIRPAKRAEHIKQQ